MSKEYLDIAANVNFLPYRKIYHVQSHQERVYYYSSEEL